MIEWHLYRKDNISTYPKFECPLLLAKDGIVRNALHFYDKDKNEFYNNRSVHKYSFNECYYAYINLVPTSYSEHIVSKCAIKNRSCEYYDDTYCLKDEMCVHRVKNSEFSINYETIY